MRWACGCLLACYTERFRIMPSSATTPISRWVLTLEMLIGFVPLTYLFVALAAIPLSWPGGYPRGPALLRPWLLYCSCTLVGPLGLIMAGRVVVLGRPIIGRATMILLGVLAAWTPVAYTGQVIHDPQSMFGSWRELVLLALLPALAAAQLIAIDARARRSVAAT
jgi:hypothetical protein